MEDRRWVRVTDYPGHSLILMEPDLHKTSRERVFYGMTDMVLHYLDHCGSDPGELCLIGESLWPLLAKWWDKHNRFVSPEEPLPAGYDRWRVFWKPIVIPAEPGELVEPEDMPL